MPTQKLPPKVIMLGVLEANQDSTQDRERPYRLKRAYQLWPLSGSLLSKKQPPSAEAVQTKHGRMYLCCIIVGAMLIQILLKHFQ